MYVKHIAETFLIQRLQVSTSSSQGEEVVCLQYELAHVEVAATTRSQAVVIHEWI